MGIGRRLFKIEQIAVSEAFRAHGLADRGDLPAFQHYFRRSLKRYMHWRIGAWLERTPTLQPTPAVHFAPRNAVRVFNRIDRAVEAGFPRVSALCRGA